MRNEKGQFVKGGPGFTQPHTEESKEKMRLASITHGMHKTSFYGSWSAMKVRCDNKKAINYYLYGGRGITYYSGWKDFENFRDDMYESYLKHAEEFGEKNTSIDRINNDGNYEPMNCRWATREEQQNNMRANRLLTYNGKTQNVTQWAEELGINRGTIYTRLSKNCSTEEALDVFLDKRNVKK